MARSFNVLYRFLAKDSFSGVSKKIQTNNKKLGKSFKKLDGDMKKSGGVFKNTSRSFIGGFKQMAAAAVGFFGIRSFFSIGGQFQDAMAELSAITGATGKDLQFFQKDILRLARSAKIAQNEVADAFTQVASAKSELLKTPKSLAAVTEQVLLLANAGKIDIPTAIQASVGALNQFGAGADQAGRFVNVMAAGAKVGASTIAQTAQAMTDAGFAGFQAGLSFEETNAAIQVLSKSQLKGARAGVAMRNIFSRLQKAFDGKFDPAVIGITASLEAMASKQLTNIEMSELFGEETKNAAGFLIQNRALFRQWAGEITGTSEAQIQAAKNLNTFTARMRGMGIVLKEVVIRTFLRLEPIISKNVESFTRFLETIDAKQIDAFADSLSTVIDVAAGIATGFKIVFAILKGIGTAIGELIGQFATLNFSEGLSTSFTDAFSVGGKFLGLFGDDAPGTGKPIGQDSKSTTDINMNINAPEGTVESVQSTTTGRGANVGLNMAGG